MVRAHAAGWCRAIGALCPPGLRLRQERREPARADDVWVGIRLAPHGWGRGRWVWWRLHPLPRLIMIGVNYHGGCIAGPGTFVCDAAEVLSPTCTHTRSHTPRSPGDNAIGFSFRRSVFPLPIFFTYCGVVNPALNEMWELHVSLVNGTIAVRWVDISAKMQQTYAPGPFANRGAAICCETQW